MKLLSYALGLAAGMVIIFSGCSKNGSSNPIAPTTSTTPPLVGKWTVISGLDSSKKYVLFNSDNSYSFLEEYAYGIRDMQTGVYQLDSSTVNFAGSPYTYTLKNDTLTLSTPQQTIISYRAPATLDLSWVKSALILDNLSTPIDTLTDIGLHGDTLWYGNGTLTNHLFRMMLGNKAVDTSLTVNVSAWAVEWDGTSLWCSNGVARSITRINPATGTPAFTSRPIASGISGIAADSTSVWCSGAVARSLYRYSPASNTILTTLPLGVQPTGLAYAGGHLYVCVNGIINVCETTPFKAIAAYRIPGAQAFGIASNGSTFWVSCSVTGGYKVYKVSLP